MRFRVRWCCHPGCCPPSRRRVAGLRVVAPSNSSLCPAPRVHGWTFGSSDVAGRGGGRPGFQHLVMTGSPRVETRPSRAADGPLVYPEAISPRGRIVVNGRPMRFYAVPMGNPSAFRGHLVLIWNDAGHTFVYGFHVVASGAIGTRPRHRTRPAPPHDVSVKAPLTKR